MAQFINPRTIGYPTCCDQPTVVIPVISSYAWLDPEAYMGRFDDDPSASWSSCYEDYEEHLPTCPRMDAVASLSDEGLPHLDPVPAHVWEQTYSTYYAGYNRADLY